MSAAAPARERRVARRLEARGLAHLGEHLARFRGTPIDGRWELGSLFAVGSDGALYLCHDVWDAKVPVRLAKVPLHRYDEPDLGSEAIGVRRDRLRTEATRLKACASAYMPGYVGLVQFANPLLEAMRGGEFALAEPALLMERVPGFDLAKWLGRVHASKLPREVLRNNVDHVAVVVMRALWDLHERGFLYADIRPAKIRMCGRSAQRVRLVDAGALIPRGQETPGFPHDPAYLPPSMHARFVTQGDSALEPSLKVQAVMAGRTLFEVATGIVPRAGRDLDDAALFASECVSPDVAEIIAGLCQGTFRDVFQALRTLVKRTQRGKVRRAPAPAAAEVEAPKAAIPDLTVPIQAVDLAKVLAEARVAAHNRPLVPPPPAKPPRPVPKPEPPKPAAPPVPVAVVAPEPAPVPAAMPDLPAPAPASSPATEAPPPAHALQPKPSGLRTQGSRFAMPSASAANPSARDTAGTSSPAATALPPAPPQTVAAAKTPKSAKPDEPATPEKPPKPPARPARPPAAREPDPDPEADLDEPAPAAEPSIDDILPVHVIPAPWYLRLLRRLGL